MVENFQEPLESFCLTHLERLQQAVVDAPQQIKEEMERVGNDWLQAYMTSLTEINVLFYLAVKEGEIKGEEFVLAKDNLGVLVSEVEKMSGKPNLDSVLRRPPIDRELLKARVSQVLDKGDNQPRVIVPQTKRDELLARLNIFVSCGFLREAA